MNLSSKMKELRTEKGYTQREMADRLRIDRSTYTYMEQGKTLPNIYTIFRIAQILCVDYTVLTDAAAGITRQ